MNKERAKIRIKQTMVLTASCIVTSVIGVSILTMLSINKAPEKAEVEGGYAIEQEQYGKLKQSGTKYVLRDPEEKIETNITSEVTEETDTQKSNRLEDIMDVLASETE